MNNVKTKLVEALEALDAWSSENPDALHIRKPGRKERVIVFRSYICLQNWVRVFGRDDGDLLITYGSMVAGHRFKEIVFVGDPEDSARTPAERVQIAEWVRDCITCRALPDAKVFYV